MRAAASRLRGVIFDLDGTLADSLEDIAEAMNGTLTRRGLPTHGLDDYRTYVGEGIEKLVRRSLPEAQVGALAEVVDEFRAAYRALDHAHTRPYPGIEAMLDGLAARGVPMAVLSNKRDDFTRQLVHKRLGRWSFVDVRGEREGVPRKPDPTAARELVALLGAPPGALAFVGDTAIDMRTAAAVGMVGVGVLWGFRSREELLGAGARHLLEKPSELLELFGA